MQLPEPQQQMEEQPQEMNVPYPMQRTEKADIIDKIRPEDVVEKLKHELMGEEFVEGRWVPDPDLQAFSLSKRGAKAVAKWMLPVSSKNVAFSNLTEREIKFRVLSIANGAVDECIDNWMDYGVKSPTTLDYVWNAVFSNSLVALKQCQDNGMRRMMMSIITELSMQSNMPGDSKAGGFWNTLFKARDMK